MLSQIREQRAAVIRAERERMAATPAAERERLAAAERARLSAAAARSDRGPAAGRPAGSTEAWFGAAAADLDGADDAAVSGPAGIGVSLEFRLEPMDDDEIEAETQRVVSGMIQAGAAAAAAAAAGEAAGPRRAGRGQPSSHVGAIMHLSDDSDSDEVEENSMYHRRFAGHRCLSSVKNLALMGPRSEYVVSGSDDGRIFIWDRSTGDLVNMLGPHTVDVDDPELNGPETLSVNAVAPHPFYPMLASAGHSSVVNLWSPEVRIQMIV